jgi:hypothetical protein
VKIRAAAEKARAVLGMAVGIEQESFCKQLVVAHLAFASDRL